MFCIHLQVKLLLHGYPARYIVRTPSLTRISPSLFLSNKLSGNHLAEVPPSELRHRAAGETDTREVSVHYLSAHDVLLAGTGNSRFPVWQACCHDVPRIYMAMIFLVCWEKSWFLETWSKTLKQRASPAVVFYRNFKTEVKVRICSEPPEEPGKEIQKKTKGGVRRTNPPA